MATAITILIIGTLLCLAFERTRLFGCVGLATLIQLYPLYFIVMLVLAGVIFYFIHNHH
jgi:hypothetical protein